MATKVLIPEARPEYIVGNWYPSIRGTLAAGALITANELRLLPFYIARPITISQLHCRVTTQVTSGNAQLAVYANNPLINKPTGAALAVTGNISTTGVGGKDTDITGADVALLEGWYWGAIMVDATAAPTAIFQTIALAQNTASFYMGAASSISISAGGTTGAMVLSYANPGAYGSWPDVTGVTFTEVQTSGSASIGFKVSAVP
jgi:hypothetical protein